MGKLATIARRSFLIRSAAVVGGVAFGVYKYKQPAPNPLLGDLRDGATALTPYVRIDAQGVTLITPRAEMGQGIHWRHWWPRNWMSRGTASASSTARRERPTTTGS